MLCYIKLTGARGIRPLITHQFNLLELVSLSYLLSLLSTRALTHSLLTDSLTEVLTHSLSHSITVTGHSLTHSITHSLTHRLTHSPSMFSQVTISISLFRVTYHELVNLNLKNYLMRAKRAGHKTKIIS